MRVIFTPWPAKAHLYPIVPLAWALQSAGHEVRVAAHPDLADSVAALGLLPVALGDGEPIPEFKATADLEAALDRLHTALDPAPAESHLWDALRAFCLPLMWDFHPLNGDAAAIDPCVRDLVSFAQHWQPDLVLWDACFPSGAVAARASGAANVRMLWGVDYWGWLTDRLAERRDTLPADVPTTLMADTIRPVAERYGVAVDDELLLGQWTIDPTPTGMRLQTSARTVPMRWVPFTGTATVPTWLYAKPERPRVTVSLGVSMRAYYKESQERVASLLEMVSTMDVDVVATLNKQQLEGISSLPDNVRTVDYLPLTLLLPSTSAFIHHGGNGSFAAAATAGVPQLITSDTNTFTATDASGVEHTFVAQHPDVPTTTAYLERHGAGLTLNHQESTVPEMRDRLERVLHEPSFRRGAAALQDDVLATPSPVDLVPLLERTALSRRTR